MEVWISECLKKPAPVRSRLVCGCAAEVLPLWEKENESDEGMAGVVDALLGWCGHSSVENLLAVYRGARRVSGLWTGWDLSPVEGLCPPRMGSTSAGDYAGDCIVWAGRAVAQYHAGILYSMRTEFDESVEKALHAAVEAVARSRESGWGVGPSDIWGDAQAILATRLAHRVDERGTWPEPEAAAPAGLKKELAEMLAWVGQR